MPAGCLPSAGRDPPYGRCRTSPVHCCRIPAAQSLHRLFLTTPTFELERDRHKTDDKGPLFPGDAGNERSGTAAGAPSETCANKHHGRILQCRANLRFRFLSGLETKFRITTGREALPSASFRAGSCCWRPRYSAHGCRCSSRSVPRRPFPPERSGRGHWHRPPDTPTMTFTDIFTASWLRSASSRLCSSIGY